MSSTFHGVLTLVSQLHQHVDLTAATPPALPLDSGSAAPVATPVSGAPVTTPVPSGTTPSAPGAAVFTLPALVLSIFVWSTFIGALVVLFMPERTEQDGSRIRSTGLSAALVAFVVAFLTTWGQISTPDPGGGSGNDDASAGLFESHRWLEHFSATGSYHLDIDGISLPLMMLSCLVFTAALLMLWKRSDRLRHHVVLLLMLETGVNGALCARDFLLLLGFFGMILLPLYVLVREPARALQADGRRERAASRMLGFNLAALALFITGGLLAVTQAARVGAPGGPPPPPTFDLTAITAQTFPGPVAIAGFVMMFVAFLIVSGGFPFHRWLIDVAGEADAATAAIVVGVVSRLGGYAMLHVALVAFPQTATTYSTAIVALAVLTTLWGAFAALVESDMRRMVAYVALAETGAVLLGIAGLNKISAMGAVIMLVSGGLNATLLILIAGAVEERTKHRSIHRLGGLAVQMPRLAAFWVVVALSTIGVPLLAGFSADLMLFTGSFPQHRWATVVVMAGLTLAGSALLWNFQRIFLGPAREIFSRVKDGTALEFTYLTPALVLLLLYGVLPGRIMLIIANGVESIIALRLGGG